MAENFLSKLQVLAVRFSDQPVNVRKIFLSQLFSLALKQAIRKDVESIYASDIGATMTKEEIFKKSTGDTSSRIISGSPTPALTGKSRKSNVYSKRGRDEHPDSTLDQTHRSDSRENIVSVSFIRKLANTNNATVFATDSILSNLMCVRRSVCSWDIVIQRVGNKLFSDKRSLCLRPRMILIVADSKGLAVHSETSKMKREIPKVCWVYLSLLDNLVLASRPKHKDIEDMRATEEVHSQNYMAKAIVKGNKWSSTKWIRVNEYDA
ncbi:eukaryotic translation initiation factor 3 subunit D [Artemisia annua]|uniref:Eukaryotic translation initiation factor 3 subunit D n=1 Tax=Artemisia annua TaxID=35608 RepID=A0A2U1LE90_ARTAN|nr:eukaryotic translation initiation factor 3 subunit D [Artemisia annua]